MTIAQVVRGGYQDWWLQPDALVKIDGFVETVVIKIYLPDSKKDVDYKVISITDGSSFVTEKIKRGIINFVAFPAIASEMLILRILSRYPENSVGEDERKLGVVLTGITCNTTDAELTFSLEEEDELTDIDANVSYPGSFVINHLVDQTYYRKQLANDAILLDPTTDYVAFGWREGLNPSDNFDTKFYLEQSPDLQGMDVCPIIHFEQYGRQRGLPATPDEAKRKESDKRLKEGVPPTNKVAVVDLVSTLQNPLLFDLEYFKNRYKLKGNVASTIADYLGDPMREASPYFDPQWYADRYLEGKSVGFEALSHYLNTGRDAGLHPSHIFNGSLIELKLDDVASVIDQSGLFDAEWYLYKNSDVARAGANPLRHYARVGHAEYKRTPNALFNNNFYISQAIDVSTFKWHPLIHYIFVGADKGLSPHQMFDSIWLAKVAAPGQKLDARHCLSNFLNRKYFENVGPNEFFDPEYYESREPDAKNFPGGSIAHYLEVGWKTLTAPSRNFNPAGYLSANPDVKSKGGNPLLHFLNSGRAEGRDPNPRETCVPATLERFSEPEYGAMPPIMEFDADATVPEDFNLSVAVHLHLYYVEMAEEFCARFEFIPVPFHLYVSVPPGRGDAVAIQAVFEKHLVRNTGVTVVSPANRGRDVAPFLVELGKELLRYDLVLHLHSKKSPHSPKHADWRRYLLHYTLGNQAIVSQILTAFHADPKIGVFQPPYHPQVHSQPKWGENRNKVSEWLPRLGLSYVGDSCPDFPAGSFFWVRPDALRPLLDGRIKIEDFDDEAGQIDSTLAHALERLFGLVPVLRGYSVVSRFIDVAHNMVNYYGKSRFFSKFANNRNKDIIRYQKEVRARKNKRGSIAVVTAISGPFDALLLPEYLESQIDYFCISDSVSDGYGVFRIVPPPYVDADARRSARYIKTNLLRLFPGYEFVVWIDANVLACRAISIFVDETKASGCHVGAIPHPTRRSYIEEAEIATEMKLDEPELIAAQMAAYSGENELADANLIETNFMVFDARRPQTAHFTQLWWNQINTFSRRDQLSVNYCLLQAGVKWHRLLPEFMSTRDSPHFALFRHGLNQWGPKPHIYSSWYEPHSHDGHLLPLPDSHSWAKQIGQLDLDVVVCVHNALEDVRMCLASVEQALAGRGKLILVDDASKADTASFLADYADKTGAHLIRNDEQLGYTKAANAGVRAGKNRNVLLLNSDTIVPPGALDKLSDNLDRDALLGILGPLSNAASFQSVPSTIGTATQTAINQIPPGMSAADMDIFLERRWDGSIPRTPLVHGFCFCVKRAVFEKIGLFDEVNFPRGYGEENDFCFRAGDAGFDLGVLTNTYVFHAKSKSYGEAERTTLMDEGMAALIRKVTKPRIARSIETMRKQTALTAAQEAVYPLFTQVKAVKGGRRGRLFLMPSLRSDGLAAGSGYVRVLLPYRSEEVCREWEVRELRTPILPELAPGDAIVVQREAGVIGSDVLEDWIASVRQRRVRLVYEIDDDLLNGDALKKRGFRGDTNDLARRVVALARAADCVTVSSDALLTKFTSLNRSTKLIPNALDPYLWQMADGLPHRLLQRPNRQMQERIVIGYVGTPTHGEDLSLVRDAIKELHLRFPERLDIQIIGGFGPKEKTFGNVIPLPRANDYPSFVRWLRATAQWDIGLVPLVNSAFNKYKSFLKYVELSALGMAVVCSDGPEYAKVIDNGRNGLLISNNTRSWADALTGLVIDSDERRRLATNAYRDVVEQHTYTQLAPQLLDILASEVTAVA